MLISLGITRGTESCATNSLTMTAPPPVIASNKPRFAGVHDRRVLNGIFLLLLGRAGGTDSESHSAFFGFMASSVRVQTRASSRSGEPLAVLDCGRQELELKAETYSFKPGSVRHEPNGRRGNGQSCRPARC